MLYTLPYLATNVIRLFHAFGHLCMLFVSDEVVGRRLRCGLLWEIRWRRGFWGRTEERGGESGERDT